MGLSGTGTVGAEVWVFEGVWLLVCNMRSEVGKVGGSRVRRAIRWSLGVCSEAGSEVSPDGWQGGLWASVGRNGGGIEA